MRNSNRICLNERNICSVNVNKRIYADESVRFLLIYQRNFADSDLERRISMFASVFVVRNHFKKIK